MQHSLRKLLALSSSANTIESLISGRPRVAHNLKFAPTASPFTPLVQFNLIIRSLCTHQELSQVPLKVHTLNITPHRARTRQRWSLNLYVKYTEPFEQNTAETRSSSASVSSVRKLRCRVHLSHLRLLRPHRVNLLPLHLLRHSRVRFSPLHLLRPRRVHLSHLSFLRIHRVHLSPLLLQRPC